MADPDVRTFLMALQHRIREHGRDVGEAIVVLRALLRTWIPDPENPEAQRTGRRVRRLLAAWQERICNPRGIHRR